jgi:heavy metal sensor kinase
MNDASPTARPASLNALWHTLRFRLAVWNATVVVVTALLTLFGLRQGVQWALLREVDQALFEDTREIELALEGTSSNQFEQLQEQMLHKAIGHKQRGWYIKFCDANDRIIWTTPGAPEITPPPPSASDPLAPWTYGEFRTVRRPVPRAVKGIEVVRVGATLNHVYDDVARIDQYVLLAAGCVLLAAPLCGYWLAARAARTVGAITEAASRMRPAHLDERLPISGTGDELDRLAHTINGLLDRIAEHVKRRRDFLANAAHELRTPLAAIRSSVEVTLASERSPDAYRELLEDIIDEGSALETLVNQLLLISESEPEREHREWERVQLDEVVTKAMDMFRGVAETRDTSLVAERMDHIAVPGNRGHLRQVINNLLDNAIKYTSRGGEVRVRLESIDDGERVRLSVADNGAGIDAEDVTVIFDRFFRTNRARSRDETHGAGLGLSICKSVVESHHGTIRCESMLGRGTTMIVELPAIVGAALPV